MTIPENERAVLSKESFLISCPTCNIPTTPVFSKWEIQVIQEHKDAFVQIECNKCGHAFSYTPFSKQIREL